MTPVSARHQMLVHKTVTCHPGLPACSVPTPIFSSCPIWPAPTGFLETSGASQITHDVRSTFGR